MCEIDFDADDDDVVEFVSRRNGIDGDEEEKEEEELLDAIAAATCRARFKSKSSPRLREWWCV